MRFGVGGGGRLLRGGASVGRGGVRGGAGVGPFSVSGGSRGGGMTDSFAEAAAVLLPVLLRILFYLTLFALVVVGTVVLSIVCIPILLFLTVRPSSKLNESRWARWVSRHKSAILLSGVVGALILFFYGFGAVSLARDELDGCEPADSFTCAELAGDLRMWETLQPLLIIFGFILILQLVLILGISRFRGKKIENEDFESAKQSLRQLREKVRFTKQRALGLRQQAAKWLEDLDSEEDASMSSKEKDT
jgi:hypothetical protein